MNATDQSGSSRPIASRQAPHFAIIGAGIAGLSSAIALMQAGFKVSIFEQTSQISEIGAGLQLSPNATHILAQWGLLQRLEEKGFKPEGVRFHHWKSGRNIARFPLNHKNTRQNQQSPYIHIHRSDLQNILLGRVLQLSADCLHLDKQVRGLSLLTENMELVFSDGNSAAFDWVIGADGIHSLCKNFISPANNERFTGNIAWRGLIPASLLEKKLGKKPEACAHLVMAPKAHLVFYYVKGGAFLNYVAIKETTTLASESWTEKGTQQELLENFSDWHPDFINLLALSDAEACYKWALHDRDPLTSWSKDRCIISGDAAHPVLPFLAQGAAMAIEDAQALAHVFKNHQDKSVQELGEIFYRLRAERCAKVLEASRANMKLYHESSFIKRFIRDSGVRIFSVIYPEFLNKKLEWLYQYELNDIEKT